MPRRDDYDDYEDRPGRSAVPFPGGVKAAGIIWIAVGALGLINAVLNLVLSAGRAAAGPQPGGAQPSPYAGVGCGVLIALAFLIVGVQTVKGTAKSTLGNGIGSIIFGVLQLMCGGAIMAGSGFLPAAVDKTIVLLVGAFTMLLGVSLIIAGTLALMGKSQYEEWRAAEGLDRPLRPRTQEERDYDDDRPRRPRRDFDEDDDRPRRRPRDEDEDDDRPRRPRDED